MADKVNGGGLMGTIGAWGSKAADTLSDVAKTATDAAESGVEVLKEGAKELVADGEALVNDTVEGGKDSYDELTELGASARKRFDESTAKLAVGIGKTAQDVKEALSLPNPFASDPRVTSDVVRDFLEKPALETIQQSMETSGIHVSVDVKSHLESLETAFSSTASAMGVDNLAKSVVVAMGGGDVLGVAPEERAKRVADLGTMFANTISKVDDRLSNVMGLEGSPFNTLTGLSDEQQAVGVMAVKASSMTSVFQLAYETMESRVVDYVSSGFFGEVRDHFGSLDVGEKTRLSVSAGGDVYEGDKFDLGVSGEFSAEVECVSRDPDVFRMNFAVKGAGEGGVGVSARIAEAKATLGQENEVVVSLDVNRDEMTRTLQHIAMMDGDGASLGSVMEWAGSQNGITFHGASFSNAASVGGEIDFEEMGLSKGQASLLAMKAELAKVGIKYNLIGDGKGGADLGYEWSASSSASLEAGFSALGLKGSDSGDRLVDTLGLRDVVGGQVMGELNDIYAEAFGGSGLDQMASMQFAVDGKVEGLAGNVPFSQVMSMKGEMAMKEGKVELVLSRELKGLDKHFTQEQITMYLRHKVTSPVQAEQTLVMLAAREGVDLDDLYETTTSVVFHRKDAVAVGAKIDSVGVSVNATKMYAPVVLGKWGEDGKEYVSWAKGREDFREALKQTRAHQLKEQRKLKAETGASLQYSRPIRG